MASESSFMANWLPVVHIFCDNFMFFVCTEATGNLGFDEC
jgi:hypothetical protein